jgi:hypothetical protein
VTTSRAIVVLAFSLLLSSCGNSEPSPAQQPIEATPSSSLTEADIALLDRVTTLEAVVPDAAERALYMTNESITEGAQRSYTFGLKPQASMDPARHFQIVSVAWARPGAFASDPSGDAGLSGTGGPNGGFVDQISRTPDGTYDVRVSLGELLPNDVRTAAVDPATVTRRVLDEYAKATSRQP